VTQELCVIGERRVAVESWGSPTGMPVFLLHGTPGSRNGPRPRASVLYRLGVRLISYDRPGYGESTPRPGRTVADAAADVLAIADQLGLEDFGVVGRSGGGPHALACGALLGDRVKAVACLVGLAPSDATGLDWFAGMSAQNTREYKSTRQVNGKSCRAGQKHAVDSGPEEQIPPLEIRAYLAAQARIIRQNPEHLLSELNKELADPDKPIVHDIAIKDLLTKTYAEAVRQGENGWIDDIVALSNPWAFALDAIKVPVLLWHGAKDVFSPVAHTRWLAERITDSVVSVQRDAAHFSGLTVLPMVLTWIKDPASSEIVSSPDFDGSEGLGVESTHQAAFHT
jgi:pimeloyl-ACP methyl ester carboxylesterase